MVVVSWPRRRVRHQLTGFPTNLKLLAYRRCQLRLLFQVCRWNQGWMERQMLMMLHPLADSWRRKDRCRGTNAGSWSCRAGGHILRAAGQIFANLPVIHGQSCCILTIRPVCLPFFFFFFFFWSAKSSLNEKVKNHSHERREPFWNYKGVKRLTKQRAINFWPTRHMKYERFPNWRQILEILSTHGYSSPSK